MRRSVRPALLAVVAILVVAIAASSVPAGAKRAAAGKAYTAKLSYTETNHGTTRGAATTGIQGKGTLSAKLGARAAVVSAFVSLATGVPVTKIAQGGAYKVRRDIAGNGVITGLVVLKLKARGLGTVCVKYTERPGRFVPGSSFVPMSGSISAVGGTGAAARWRGTVTFRQSSVSGNDAREAFGAAGAEHASLGRSRGLTAACRRVARIR